MPEIKLGPTLPVAPSGFRVAAPPRAKSATTAAASATAQPVLAASDALDPGQPPVNADRVATIRKAIDDGSYPVIPMRVADAMIAAGMLLRSPRG
jgi:negative regulator of flagellin synthesis FlgM